MTMKNNLTALKKYFADRSDLVIGIGVVTGLIAFVAIVAIVTTERPPTIVHQPSKACDLLTKDEAAEFLGEDPINSINTDIIANENIATSQCGYTDRNPDQNAMMVAAVAVRSGINDQGIEQNKNDFAKSKDANNTESVDNVGSIAFFNQTNGQLNVLNDNDWLIINYGVGSEPQSNTIDDAVDLAKKVLQDRAKL